MHSKVSLASCARRALILGAISVVGAMACDPPPMMLPSGQQAGCDTLVAGTFTCTFNNGRMYLLFRPPAALSGAGQAPMVIDAHGFTQTAQIQMDQSGWREQAMQSGIVVAYPQGIGNAFNAQGQCCDFANATDDLGFFRSIITRTQAAGRIDAARVFATGFSNGGSMAHTLACTSADMIAAIAPVSFSLAGPGGPFNAAMVAQNCRPSRPVAMIQTHGTADGLANYQSGLLDSLPAVQSLIAWGMVDGCSDAPGTMTRFTSNTVCEVRTAGCQRGTFVGLCTATGAGHLNVYSFIANTGMTVPQIVYPMLLQAAAQRQ
jgi:polyhydroxybutyrate depolymerase